MKLTYPEIGSQVEVHIQPRGEAEFRGLARLLDETPQGLIIGVVEGEGKSLLPSLNTSLKVHFTLKDAAYVFASIVLQRKEVPYRVCYIAKPLAMERQQQRAFLRVDCQLPISLIRQNDPDRKLIAGTVTNLSAGGCAVTVADELAIDAVLDLKFELGEDGKVVDNASGKVISQKPVEGGKQTILQFEAMDNETRDAVVRYTFQLEQKARRAQKFGKGKAKAEKAGGAGK